MRRKVLVVDDDREIVLGTTLRLRFAGYDSVTAFDGREGISAGTRAASGRNHFSTSGCLEMERVLAMIRELKKPSGDLQKFPFVIVVGKASEIKRRALEAERTLLLDKPCRQRRFARGPSRLRFKSR